MIEKKKGNKNFMSLSKEDCLTTYQDLLDNANGAYNDALALAQNGSFGRGISLLMVSMEESMKSFILYLDGNGFQFRQKATGIESLFKNHQLRYPLAFMLSVLHIFTQDLKTLLIKVRKEPRITLELKNDQKNVKQLLMAYIIQKLQVIISESVWFSEAEIYRQEGLYVDYSDVLKTPLSANEQQFKDVKLRIDSLREFNKSFFGVFDLKDEEFQKQVKEIQRQFIDENLYTKMSASIEKIKNNKINPFEAISKELNDLLKKNERKSYFRE